MPLHYITPHYTTLHCTILHYIKIYRNRDSIPLHYSVLQYITTPIRMRYESDRDLLTLTIILHLTIVFILTPILTLPLHPNPALPGCVANQTAIPSQKCLRSSIPKIPGDPLPPSPPFPSLPSLHPCPSTPLLSTLYHILYIPSPVNLAPVPFAVPHSLPPSPPPFSLPPPFYYILYVP